MQLARCNQPMQWDRSSPQCLQLPIDRLLVHAHILSLHLLDEEGQLHKPSTWLTGAKCQPKIRWAFHVSGGMQVRHWLPFSILCLQRLQYSCIVHSTSLFAEKQSITAWQERIEGFLVDSNFLDSSRCCEAMWPRSKDLFIPKILWLRASISVGVVSLVIKPCSVTIFAHRHTTNPIAAAQWGYTKVAVFFLSRWKRLLLFDTGLVVT